PLSSVHQDASHSPSYTHCPRQCIHIPGHACSRGWLSGSCPCLMQGANHSLHHAVPLTCLKCSDVNAGKLKQPFDQLHRVNLLKEGLHENVVLPDDAKHLKQSAVLLRPSNKRGDASGLE